MSTLTLVRHGQAHTFDSDSDRLTDLGEMQARTLGNQWVSQGLMFDEVYSGMLTRQRRTAELVEERYLQSGISWPGIISTQEFNEYDSTGILNRLAPELTSRDDRFKSLVTDFEQNRNAPDRNRYFQSMFEAITMAWLNGRIVTDGVEPWHQFRDRVTAAIKRIINAEGGGRRVAVFTSGGVIGLAVQQALEAPDKTALEINWRVRNCSLTEFLFSRGRISLDSFNVTGHLEEGELITYR